MTFTDATAGEVAATGDSGALATDSTPSVSAGIARALGSTVEAGGACTAAAVSSTAALDSAYTASPWPAAVVAGSSTSADASLKKTAFTCYTAASVLMCRR